MFNEEKRICSNEDCKKEFTAKVYNATYCTPNCRKLITNKKLLESYHTKKANKNKKRICKTNLCTTVLSSYNKEDICEACKEERYVQRLVSWGWDEKKVRNNEKQ